MLNLTRQERGVILFLASIALIGVGINFLSKKYSKIEAVTHFYKDIGKINLNSADKNLLMSVSGIGEKLAERIIKYRNEHAGFKELEELKNIKGISGNKYEKIKNSFILK